MGNPIESTRADLAQRILMASVKVSQYSTAIKPFVRFSPFEEDAGRSIRLWDFDDQVQGRLLGLLRAVADPLEIYRLSAGQWGRNLAGLLRESQAVLRRVADDGELRERRTRTAHIERFARHLGNGCRVLQIGTGTGPTCIWLAERGFRAVGVDLLVPLLRQGGRWCDVVGRPADFMAMDAGALGFASGSFDAVMTMYGFHPTPAQSAAFLDELRRVLRPGGFALVTAVRKKYSSYWYLMDSPYPAGMSAWLLPQSTLDFRHSGADGCEERLRYGLFLRSHTIDSFASEVSAVFDVVECSDDTDDPRYVSAVVRSSMSAKSSTVIRSADRDRSIEVDATRLLDIENELCRIEYICMRLEEHSRSVSGFFEQREFVPSTGWFRDRCRECDDIVSRLDTLELSPSGG